MTNGTGGVKAYGKEHGNYAWLFVKHAWPYILVIAGGISWAVGAGIINVPAMAGDVKQLEQRVQQLDASVRATRRNMGSVQQEVRNLSKQSAVNTTKLDSLGHSAQKTETRLDQIINLLLQRRRSDAGQPIRR